MFFIHKHEVALASGGSEEGGWWYEIGVPAEHQRNYTFSKEDEEKAYKICRALNEVEQKRAKQEEAYEYTSVLSYHSTHYSYSVEEFWPPKPYPETRPHYE